MECVSFGPEPHKPYFDYLKQRFVANCPHDGWYDVQQERVIDSSYEYKEKTIG